MDDSRNRMSMEDRIMEDSYIRELFNRMPDFEKGRIVERMRMINDKECEAAASSYKEKAEKEYGKAQ